MMLLLILCFLLVGVSPVFANLPYPYTNGFESTADQSHWELSGYWSVTSDTSDRVSYSGLYHLDNNPSELDQSQQSTDQEAKLLDVVAIPSDAIRPVLTYLYRLNINAGDYMIAEVLPSGATDWIYLKKYEQRDNHDAYTKESLDLSDYKGQQIQIRFRQSPNAISGPRTWLIDDLFIGEDPVPPEYGYPYSNAFETSQEQAAWNLQGSWGILDNQGDRTSYSGSYHLDNNPASVDQRFYRDGGQLATLNGQVTIPADAIRPILTYRYNLDLLDGDYMYVKVRTPDSNQWTHIREYRFRDNHTGYTREGIDLSAYKGQSIQLRFEQWTGSGNGSRTWLIDELFIGEDPVPPELTYPYSNGFETAEEQAIWNLQGSWGIQGAQGSRLNKNGAYHLDNNPTELNQRFYHDGGQLATLNGQVTIPVDAVRPVLSYWYDLTLLDGDNMCPKVRTSDSSDWVCLKIYQKRDNHTGYTRETLDLSAYKGQSIQLRFEQWNNAATGSRTWLLDDVYIGEEPPLSNLSYPYNNGFETASELADWNLQGAWHVVGAQGRRDNFSGSFHLDNNPDEMDLYGFTEGQLATLNGQVPIPVNAVRPILSYWYRAEQLLYYDTTYVQVRTADSDWTTIRYIKGRDNHIGYTRETLDLSAYKGQSIQIRFKQYNNGHGERLLLVDELYIGEEPIQPALSYPYSNGFETAADLADWNLQGAWQVVGVQAGRDNHSGSYHLDNNPDDLDLYGYTVGQLATLNGQVAIPANAIRPALTYWYRAEQLLYYDATYVQVRTADSDWTTIRYIKGRDNHIGYTRETLDLSAYKGQSIQIRFKQYNNGHGVRLLLIDDLMIGEEPTPPAIAYPYSNGFETADELADWNLQGAWHVIGQQGARGNHSGSYHLDNNPDEIDQYTYYVGQLATLNGQITIPTNAVLPVLSYWYQLDLVSSSDRMHVEIRPAGAVDWSILRTFKNTDDNSSYVREDISLDAYRGQTIELRFRQESDHTHGVRLWLLDDIRFGAGSSGDQDGDGVADDQDSYPNDPTRTKLTAVSGVASSQQGVAVDVQWQAHPETFVQGYRIYRADYGQANWTLLNTGNLVTSTQYADTTVANGQAYEYRVSAVDDRNIEGSESSAVSQFVIYNLSQVVDTQAAWVDYQAQVSWNHTPATNESYRLYRVESAGKVLVVDGNGTTYLDTASHWNTDQAYELVSVLSLTNPITSALEHAEGPVTPIQLPALPAIEVSLSGVTQTGADIYQIESQAGLGLTISGQYVNALASVVVVLNNSQGGTTVNSDSGEFQFVVRETVFEPMSITLTESGAPADRSVTLTLNVIDDQTPLTVELDALVDTTDDFVSVSGRVLNADAGVASVSASNDRFPGQPFGLVLVAGDELLGDVPLKAGENVITVVASGNQGQADQASVTVTRLASPIPVIEYTSHQNNDIVAENRIDLQGRVYTSLEITQLQVLVDGVAANISPVLENLYRFELAGVSLERGFNRIVTLAKTPSGSVESALVIYYQDAEVDSQAPLEIVMTTPLDGSSVSDDLLLVRGQLFNADDTAALTVNGNATTLYGDVAGRLFSTALDISAVPEGPYTVTIHAEMNGKDPLDLIINLVKDGQAPVIQVDNALSLPPAVNEIQQHPYHISGTVSDDNLSTVTINGNNLVLETTAATGEYRFAADLALEAGVETELVITAVDTAGNPASVGYTVLSNPAATIEVIRPLAGAEYYTTGAEFDVEYVARVDVGSIGDTLVVTAGSRQRATVITQTLISDIIAIDTSESIPSLTFEVVDAADEVLSSTDVDVTFINEDNLPLELVRTVPARSERYREPHHPIQFYFNKPVVLSDLTITVKQTVHGVSYTTADNAQTASGGKYQGEVVEVHKDQETVPGGLSLLPGGRIVEFYPDSDITYGATVYVNVSHLGEELSRFVYNVRENPTFIGGVVFSQDQVALEGVKVELPELGISATTDPNGVYSLGAGVPASRNIASGLYRVVINPDGENPAYGSIERMFSIEQGRMNQVRTIQVPRIDTLLPYNPLASHVQSNVLAGGDLVIDTNNAVLNFTDGSSSASVQTQLHAVTSGVYTSQHQALIPHWMFNLQPGPIKVSGAVSLEIKMPALYGSYDYLPDDSVPVLIMGLDADSLEVVPVGAGILSGGVVTTPVPLYLERLDFIGANLVAEAQYDDLTSYIDGEISLAQLLVVLTADVQ
ncbi:MAG: immune inhibitor A [Candidatus Thiodiazotropha sp. (ex Monitilora ramsayi)]|nr:immune inhibitor A [Candidatus Thiodiazotropha sp. (ex Monitilora ramsayi)]